MKLRNIVFYLPVAIIFLSGCVKDITIAPLPYASKLSIQSLITPGEIPRVFVYNTVPYFDSSILAKQLFVRTAAVFMQGGGNTIHFIPDSVYSDVRCDYDIFWRGDAAITANTTYKLTIISNGDTITATSTTNQRKAVIDSIGYVSNYKDIYGEHEGVVIHFTDMPGTGDNYRYRMTRSIYDTVFHAETQYSNCTIGKLNDVEEIGRSVYSDQNLDGRDMTFVFEPTFRHTKGDEALIYLHTIDNNIFTFYDNLDRQKLAQYNPFVEPVFIQPGQFGSKAIGVFGAYAVSDSVKFIYPE